jgi:Polycystin cation channel
LYAIFVLAVLTVLCTVSYLIVPNDVCVPLPSVFGSFNCHMSLQSDNYNLLSQMVRELVTFGVLFVLVITAFTTAEYIAYGFADPQGYTWIYALVAKISRTFAGRDFSQTNTTENRLIGTLYSLLFVIAVSLLLLNLVIAMMTTAYENAIQEAGDVYWAKRQFDMIKAHRGDHVLPPSRTCFFNQSCCGRHRRLHDIVRMIDETIRHQLYKLRNRGTSGRIPPSRQVSEANNRKIVQAEWDQQQLHRYATLLPLDQAPTPSSDSDCDRAASDYDRRLAQASSAADESDENLNQMLMYPDGTDTLSSMSQVESAPTSTTSSRMPSLGAAEAYKQHSKLGSRLS